MNRILIGASWFIRALVAAALIAPVGLNATDNSKELSDAAKKAEERELKWLYEKLRVTTKSAIGRAHIKLQSEPREDPWSSTMEAELRAYFGSKAGFAILRVDCRRLVCEVMNDGEYAQEASKNWWASIEEIRKQRWYQANFHRDYGVGMHFFVPGGRVKQPSDTKEWAGSWFMLRRDARTEGMSEQLLWEHLAWPLQSRIVTVESEVSSGKK